MLACRSGDRVLKHNIFLFGGIYGKRALTLTWLVSEHGVIIGLYLNPFHEANLWAEICRNLRKYLARYREAFQPSRKVSGAYDIQCIYYLWLVSGITHNGIFPASGSHQRPGVRPQGFGDVYQGERRDEPNDSIEYGVDFYVDVLQGLERRGAVCPSGENVTAGVKASSETKYSIRSN